MVMPSGCAPPRIMRWCLLAVLASLVLPMHRSDDAAAAWRGRSLQEVNDPAFDWGVNMPEELALRPVPSAAGDKTGSAVALSADGQLAIVGSPGRNEALAYLRTECAATGVPMPCWVVSGVLGTGAINSNAQLGIAVSLSQPGTVAVAGAPGDSTRLLLSGSAFVYSLGQQNGLWQNDATLLAADAQVSDLFGSAIALSPGGDAVVVGAPGRDECTNTLTPVCTDTGAAYVFLRDGAVGTPGGWTNGRVEQFKLMPHDLASSDAFGSAVAITASASGMRRCPAATHPAIACAAAVACIVCVTAATR